MGNKTARAKTASTQTFEGANRDKSDNSQQINENLNISLSGRSFASISSRQSTYSVSRPWSRVSRRRWKESTLTLPYESSKTAWPVSQLESTFLPEFPLISTQQEDRFEVVDVIATGAFGKVYKVVENETGKAYALKVLSKSRIVKENSVQQVKDEVQIQRVCGHHPFIVNCPLHWQSRKRLYIVSDFVQGGELYRLLESYLIFPIVLVQLYVAQIALALDFLHNAGIIYRDLKPENILLDEAGNIQLIDFGLSKWLSYGDKTKTLCGTLRYMAPEVISLQPYGHAADWWSLGVIACLMLTNQYPTSAVASDNSRAEEGRKPGSLPADAHLDVPSKDLLQRLLEVDPKRRLRSLRTLQTIAFYKGYNFEDVKNKKPKPNEMLKECFPNGPAGSSHSQDNYQSMDFIGFDSQPVFV